MALRIWNGDKQDVFLQLVEKMPRTITVVAYKENGEFIKNLIDITEEGVRLIKHASGAGVEVGGLYDIVRIIE